VFGPHGGKYSTSFRKSSIGLEFRVSSWVFHHAWHQIFIRLPISKKTNITRIFVLLINIQLNLKCSTANFSWLHAKLLRFGVFRKAMFVSVATAKILHSLWRASSSWILTILPRCSYNICSSQEIAVFMFKQIFSHLSASFRSTAKKFPTQTHAIVCTNPQCITGRLLVYLKLHLQKPIVCPAE